MYEERKVNLTYHHKTAFYQTEIDKAETEKGYFKGVEEIETGSSRG